MACDPTTVEGLPKRETNENAREDTREQAYDDDANVQPSKSRLIEVSSSRTLMCRSKVVVVSGLDRRRVLQSVCIRRMNILLVVVHARTAPGLLENPSPKVFERANIVPRAESLAPQIWCILVRRVSGEVVDEGAGRTWRRQRARTLNVRALRPRTNSSPRYRLYANSSGCLRSRASSCYA
jgi:hypothetical protein